MKNSEFVIAKHKSMIQQTAFRKLLILLNETGGLQTVQRINAILDISKELNLSSCDKPLIL